MNRQMTHLNANGTTVLKTGTQRAILYAVAINTKGATSNTLTLQDGNGTAIAVIDTTVGIGTVGYGGICDGLVAVMATGTAADVTIIWGA